MANILQVGMPNPSTENRNIMNPQDPRQNAANQAVNNPVDPTRVVRADGQSPEQGNNTQDALFSVINYESNYGAFIKGLGEGQELAGALERLLFTDMSALREAGQTEVSALVDKFLMTMRMDSPQDIMDFLQGQRELQARFTGGFFDKLRNALTQNPSESLKDAALTFLKAYNDYSSGDHLLQQMHSLTDDIEQLLLRSYRGAYREVVDAMEWEAPNGDTEQNTQVLNNRLIPFLSSYVSRTHDYGAVREATMHLIFHAVRYQNGNIGRLVKLFGNMVSDRDFVRLFGEEGQKELRKLLEEGSREAQTQRPLSEFADGLSKLLLKGANGQAGLENVQQFYTIMNGMLINESVYMPLLHFIIPFQFEDKNVVSEMWVDPDAEKDSEDEPRKIKVFLKFDIQSLGKFELSMTLQNRETKMQLLVPPQLAKQEKTIQTDVAEILKKNNIRLSQILVRERLRDRRIDEVFPEIRKKERTINVRI